MEENARMMMGRGGRDGDDDEEDMDSEEIDVAGDSDTGLVASSVNAQMTGPGIAISAAGGAGGGSMAVPRGVGGSLAGAGGSLAGGAIGSHMMSAPSMGSFPLGGLDGGNSLVDVGVLGMTPGGMGGGGGGGGVGGVAAPSSSPLGQSSPGTGGGVFMPSSFDPAADLDIGGGT